MREANFSEWNFILLIKLCLFVKRERIDVIHAHQRVPIFMAALTGFFCNVPSVATVHGDSRHDLRGRFVKKLLTSIIFINKKVFNTYTESPVIGTKIYFIPNGIVLPDGIMLTGNREGKKSRDTADSSDRVPEDRPVKIFYISRIDNRHGRVVAGIVRKVIPAVKRSFPGVTFHIVGEGEGLEKIKGFLSCEDFGDVRDSVICENYSDNVYKLYREADLVLGVGRVAAESLVNGVPLLSVKNNHLGEIITRENFEKLRYTNFVAVDSPPFDPDRAAELIIDFCQKSSFYKAETIFLQKIIREDQNISVVTNKITGIYSQISKAKRSGI